MILIVILHALWAASVTSSKILLQYTQPIFLTGIRMFIAGGLLLAYQYFYAHDHFTFKRKHVGLYLKLIIIGIYLSYCLRFWALESITASKSMFLYNLAPFITSLYCYFFFNEKMTRKQWFGLLLGVVGLVPIFLTTTAAEKSFGEFLFISWPELATLFSVAAYSYSWIVMRTLIKDHSYSPMMVNGISMFAGGFLALITAFFVEGPFPVTDFWPFAGLLTFIILISNILCHNLYGHLLRHYSATFMSFAGFMGPPFAAFYGFILKNEVITWHFYASTIIVFFALYLFYKDERQQQNGLEIEMEQL
ncbi:MAG TPA: DMT family transporter [Candidatus Babeliales bacterium]|nr:DMT family transporter [Candidatus Babeliales bacterium]